MDPTDRPATLSRRQLLALAGGAATTLGLGRVPVALASPAISKARRPAQPARGLHLSLTAGAGTTRTVTWFTDGPADRGTVARRAPIDSRGRLDRVPSAQTAVGTSSPIPGVDGLVHRATMTGLPPGGEVRYQVGGEGGFSSEHRCGLAVFGDRFRFAHLGDHGTKPTSQAATDAARADGAALVLVAGDLSYANGDQPVWDTWFDQIEPLAAAVPMMAAPGNHENKDFGGQALKQRLSQPGRGSFYGFEPTLRHRIVSLELFNRGEDHIFEQVSGGAPSPRVECLDAGWRVGLLGVTDEHGTSRGNPLDKGRTGLWVRSFDRAGVREAMLARRFSPPVNGACASTPPSTAPPWARSSTTGPVPSSSVSTSTRAPTGSASRCGSTSRPASRCPPSCTSST